MDSSVLVALCFPRMKGVEVIPSQTDEQNQ